MFKDCPILERNKPEFTTPKLKFKFINVYKQVVKEFVPQNNSIFISQTDVDNNLYRVSDTEQSKNVRRNQLLNEKVYSHLVFPRKHAHRDIKRNIYSFYDTNENINSNIMNLNALQRGKEYSVKDMTSNTIYNCTFDVIKMVGGGSKQIRRNKTRNHKKRKSQKKNISSKKTKNKRN